MSEDESSNSLRDIYLISSSLKVTPKISQSSFALFLVSVVVPKPPILIAIISLVFQFLILNALCVERSARVESNPPDTPITAFLTPAPPFV